MKIGTKSLLFGAHAFWFHPLTVFLAWVDLYGWPNWKKFVCIFVHDLGYWGSPNMEGKEGLKHPELGAWIAHYLLDSHGREYFYFVLLHSRQYAKDYGMPPSDLCWADKMCVKYDPWWFYLLRVWLSGELYEYRKMAADAGLFPPERSDREWYEWAKERMIRKALTRDKRPSYEAGS